MYLATAVAVDDTTGAFLLDPVSGGPQLTGGGLLVRWDEIEYLEFVDA